MHTPETFEITVDGAAAIASIADGWLDLSVIDCADDALPALLERVRAAASDCAGVLVRTSDADIAAGLRRNGFRPAGAVRDRPRGNTELTLVYRPAGNHAAEDGAIHPPKRETFDPRAMTNVDPKGFERVVEEFREEPFGLYMFRRADHPAFHALESWLLPDLDLRANIFHFTAGHERDQHIYLDVARVWRAGSLWHTEDWYLDLVEKPHRAIELIDVDELLEASAAELITASDAERAMHGAVRAASGITAHGYDVGAWLAAEGFPITWR